MPLSLRPDETILFEGDATILKSKLSVQEAQVIITSHRLIVGKLVVEKPNLASVAEASHGFTKKMVFTMRDGKTLSLTAANASAFKAAAQVLAGQAESGSMPAAPPLSAVKNGTAWMGAFGPIIASILAVIVGSMFWGNPDRWSLLQLLQIFLLRLVFMWLVLRVDYLTLQKQGYPVHQMGLADPLTLPFYLFSRAKVFGHSKKFGVIWCVLFGIDLLLALA